MSERGPKEEQPLPCTALVPEGVGIMQVTGQARTATWTSGSEDQDQSNGEADATVVIEDGTA